MPSRKGKSSGLGSYLDFLPADFFPDKGFFYRGRFILASVLPKHYARLPGSVLKDRLYVIVMNKLRVAVVKSFLSTVFNSQV